MLKQAGDRWTVADSTELYEVDRWSQGYFSVNVAGQLQVHPERSPDRSIDLKELTDRLQLRGVDLPVLLRFNGILDDRLDQLHRVFAKARREHEYQGDYICVFPIKVNQQRQVVEQVSRHGRKYGFGLEAGSKPELLAVVAQSQVNSPIVCNGFKDDEFIEMAMLAHKIGHRVLPVVERFSELGLILKYAEKHEVRPTIGVRVKLSARGPAAGSHRLAIGPNLA